MRKIFLLVCMAICFNAFAQQDSLIAHYPLISTANDTTGNSGPMILTNTPFLGGGIYCNGIYENSGNPDWCQAVTPVLPATIYQSFILSAKFKVDSITNSWEMPVLSGGSNVRWIACILKPDSTVALKYNNQYYQTSTLHFSTKTWHEFTITYESIDTTAKLYLDGDLACSAQCTFDQGNESDRTFSVTDWSTGNVFNGILKDLKIYTMASIPMAGVDEKSNNASFNLYPNPGNGKFQLEIYKETRKQVNIEIYTLHGVKIYATANFKEQISNEIDLSGFQKGIYFIKIHDGEEIHMEKIVLQ